jgi:3-isopropylmalate/(R)-2-methylmalate dehydratase small subunit
MRAVRTIEGTAVPLDRSDVDTDQIIPSDWLKQVERTGFEKGLFSEWRDDPGFVLNLEQFQGANVLVGGANFGTGSSREHAVWAIQQYGFEAVISPRFGDIFRNNCTKNGLVPVQVDAETGERLMRMVEDDPTTVFEIDIATRTLRAGDVETTFPLDEGTQHRFLEGLDDIGLTLKLGDEISDFETKRPGHLPTAS